MMTLEQKETLKKQLKKEFKKAFEDTFTMYMTIKQMNANTATLTIRTKGKDELTIKEAVLKEILKNFNVKMTFEGSDYNDYWKLHFNNYRLNY